MTAWPPHLPRPERFPPSIEDSGREQPFRVHRADRRLIRARARLMRTEMGLDPAPILGSVERKAT